MIDLFLDLTKALGMDFNPTSGFIAFCSMIDCFLPHHRSKYELRAFLKPSLKISSNNAKGNILQASPSKFKECMVGAIGHLKITILKGANLDVRDMLSSDPYVVSLGEQRAQTAIQKRNLNPFWNEELLFSVPEDYGPVKLITVDLRPSNKKQDISDNYEGRFSGSFKLSGYYYNRGVRDITATYSSKFSWYTS
ncbi:hypothetical protein L1987_13573 [Smallanthus sonchifolius]|uniref:Uncharacterized protein n=1 Tax=Smallanthus sonchifolius TaxID=185202 RepID=A0ACB9JJK1_9ASTR|nr:hypothetical protein L1987_13573 [Smallanthus sonchifolius]